MSEIYLGCSGWQYREWKGLFYPDHLTSKEYLNHYIKSFSTVEINSTFYRVPQQKSVLSWYKAAPKNFKYSIKANRHITHLKKFHDVQESIEEVYRIGDILAEKMGCFLFQLPPSMIFTHENLKLIISQLDLDRKNIIEFRHQSWWNNEVVSALQDSNISFCRDFPSKLCKFNLRL